MRNSSNNYPGLEKIQIPLEVLKLLDEGKSPDLFLKKLVRNCKTAKAINESLRESFSELKKKLPNY